MNEWMSKQVNPVVFPTTSFASHPGFVLLLIWLREDFSPAQSSFLFFCLFFLGPHPWHMEVPRLGVAVAYAYAMQDPSASATYTTAHSNTISLTHWAGPGIEPTSSWMLVRFVSAEPHRNSQNSFLISFLQIMLLHSSTISSLFHETNLGLSIW